MINYKKIFSNLVFLISILYIYSGYASAQSSMGDYPSRPV